MGVMRGRPTASHVRHKLSQDIELTMLYEACFDALPKFLFASN